MALMGLFVYAESDYRIHFETTGSPGAVRVSAYQVFICAINLLSATPEAVSFYFGGGKHGTDTGDKPDICIRRKRG